MTTDALEKMYNGRFKFYLERNYYQNFHQKLEMIIYHYY